MTSPWVSDSNAALLTDLYELTMLQSYFHEGMNDTAVFDLFIRRLPKNRNYFVVCGLEHVLRYLETLSFSTDALNYLRSLKRFSSEFIDSLADFRFTGDVYAVPEGTVIFPNEPILEVVAPLPQAQLVETFLMNQIQVGTLAATKAARIVLAARGRPVLDFGVRRMHGADAGLKEPRAFYVAGVAGTSSVLSGQIYGVPVAGTMAHSYVQSFDSELEAFRHFVRQFPEAILLVDTYDTLGGVRHVIELAKELGPAFRVTGIRLDSGDIRQLSIETRRLLDSSGLNRLKIFASNSLDEYSIHDLVNAGAPIDGFGVGGRMAVSEDAAMVDTAYKLVEYAGRPRIKLSKEKASLPGRKQIFRMSEGAVFKGDILAVAEETLPGEPLLSKVMERGSRSGSSEPLDVLRARCAAQIRQLPEPLLSLNWSTPYPVEISAGLRDLRGKTQALILGERSEC
jgi:nicotinate phosphoribosyltransferase